MGLAFVLVLPRDRAATLCRRVSELTRLHELVLVERCFVGRDICVVGLRLRTDVPGATPRRPVGVVFSPCRLLLTYMKSIKYVFDYKNNSSDMRYALRHWVRVARNLDVTRFATAFTALGACRAALRRYLASGERHHVGDPERAIPVRVAVVDGQADRAAHLHPMRNDGATVGANEAAANFLFRTCAAGVFIHCWCCLVAHAVEFFDVGCLELIS